MNDRDVVPTAPLSPAVPDTTATTAAPTTYIWAWSVRVRVKESELDRSFQVLIFVGSVPKDPREWISAPSYAGAFGAFMKGPAGRRAASQDPADIVTEGYVQLNHTLAKNKGMRTFDPHHVRPYLKDDLDWRVQMADGSPVPLESLPSLEVVVVAVKLAMRAGELPVPVGEPVLHRDITSGRLGGARPE